MDSAARWGPGATLVSGLLLLTAAASGRAQDLPAAVAARLDALGALPKGEKTASECRALLKLIDDDRSLSPRKQAGALDRLRKACSQKLAWTDPLQELLAGRSVSRRRSIEQEEPAAFCLALQDQGYIEHVHGRMRQAHDLYKEALTVAHRYHGRGTIDEDVAGALDSISSLLRDAPKLDPDPYAAWKTAEQSLQLRRRAVPFRPEKVVTALTTRARVEEQNPPRRADRKAPKTALETARDTLYEAYQISQTLGPEHAAEASRVTNNLGEILYRLGELSKAISVLHETERLRQDVGTRQPSRLLASTQLLLGQVYFDFGDYPQSIAYHRKAVQSHADWAGETDPSRYGGSLIGLATVLEEAGRWEEALEIQQRALKLRQDAADLAATSQPGADGEAQLLVARSLTRLGALQERMGDPQAEEPLTRALAIEERVLGNQARAERAETLLELAEHWWEAGNPERARAAIARCLRDLDEIGDQGTLRLTATELSARVAADPAVGLQTLAEASSYAASLFAPDSFYRADLLQIRAELRWRQRDRTGALGDALLAQRLSLPQVRAIVQAFPRDQALVFAADRRKSLDLALHLMAEGPPAAPNAIEQVWQVAASSRMLVRDAEIDRQRLLRATTDPQLALVAKRLASARERFAYLLVQTQGTSGTQTARLREARRELLNAEEALTARTGPLLPDTPGEPSIQQLRRRLPAGAALVAFSQYHRSTGGDAYLAFVLRNSEIRAVFVGETITLDWLVQQWREAILSPNADAKARLRAGQALRKRIWDPIVPLLADSRTVFVVPDGSLYMVPLFALPAPDSGYLIEKRWAFHTLTAERDLVHKFAPSRPGPWLALGDVDYERAAALPVADNELARDVLRGGDDEDLAAAWRGNGCQGGLPSFRKLPASRKEIQDLDRLWKRLQPQPAGNLVLTKLSGPEATERALRQAVPGQRVVHLATHGFAMVRRCGPAKPAIRGIGGLSLGKGPNAAEPGLFAGLVLAGANERGKALRSDQDGILTEEEILNLNLDAADWVVLSTCDSGLGTVQPGEGVIGILRAFQIAGAKTVIVSLWSVHDEAAREWMRELYQARFERHLSTLEAMRQATLRRLQFYRQQGDENPANWAGFVASGHWK